MWEKLNKNNFLKENSVTTSVRFTKSPYHFHKNCAPPSQTHTGTHAITLVLEKFIHYVKKKGVCWNIYVLNCVWSQKQVWFFEIFWKVFLMYAKKKDTSSLCEEDIFIRTDCDYFIIFLCVRLYAKNLNVFCNYPPLYRWRNQWANTLNDSNFVGLKNVLWASHCTNPQ